MAKKSLITMLIVSMLTSATIMSSPTTQVYAVPEAHNDNFNQYTEEYYTEVDNYSWGASLLGESVESKEFGGIKYQYSYYTNNTMTLRTFEGTGNLTIPESLYLDFGNSSPNFSGYYTVVALGDGGKDIQGRMLPDSFAGGQNFTGNLVIPSTVLSIGKSAFEDCTGLTGDIIIPDTVFHIGQSTFKNCTGFNGELKISNIVKYLDGTFENCSNLRGNLTIPDSVKYIGKNTFKNCKGFTGDLDIPENVLHIGSYAFQGCSGFTGSLNLPDNLEYIADYAFQGCTGITGKLEIPESVDSIDSYAFADCSGLAGDLVIPNNVYYIGQYAFKNCTGFTGDLKIPDSVHAIYNGAFEGCTGLTGTLTLPTGLEKNDSSPNIIEDCSVTKVVNNSAIEIKLPNTEGYHWEDAITGNQIYYISSGTAIKCKNSNNDNNDDNNNDDNPNDNGNNEDNGGNGNNNNNISSPSSNIVKSSYKTKIDISSMIPSDGAVKVKYKSSNKKIAKISKKGIVTGGKKAGTATITKLVKYNKKSPWEVAGSITITNYYPKLPKKQQLSVGGTLSMNSLLTGMDETPVGWESSKPSVVTVTSDGLVTAIAKGSAKLIPIFSSGKAKVKTTIKVK